MKNETNEKPRKPFSNRYLQKQIVNRPANSPRMYLVNRTRELLTLTEAGVGAGHWEGEGEVHRQEAGEVEGCWRHHSHP